MPAFALEVRIARDPKGVARWWLEFPAVYEATDPREQPFRIETVERVPGKVVVRTWWRMMGMTRVFDEPITTVDPLAFDAHITMGRVEVFDIFPVEGDRRGGSVMRIRTRMEGKGVGGGLAAWMMAPVLHRFMPKVWRDAAQLCAEDGRRAARGVDKDGGLAAAGAPRKPLGDGRPS